ncbi:MAG: hypothetical protein O3B05_00495 [archaeon]|nr:hypothetical protein [archaeon]
MHAAAKWTLIVAGVLVVIGVVGTVAGLATLEEGTPFVVDDVADFVGTEGDVVLDMGASYTVYAKSTCDAFDMTVDLDGAPYAWEEVCDPYFDTEVWTHVATMNGPANQEVATVTVSSAAEIAVVNDVEYFANEGGILAGIGFLSCCLGVLALALGILLMLVLDEPMPAGVAYPQMGMVGATPVAVPAQAVMGTPGAAQAWGMPQHMMATGAVAGMVPVVPQGTTVVAAPVTVQVDPHAVQHSPTPDEHGLLPPAPVGGTAPQPPVASAPAPSPAPAPAPVPLSESRPAGEALAQNDAFWSNETEDQRRPGDEFMS